MGKNDKSYSDLQKDGERIAFLIITMEFEKAREIIKSYEESESYIKQSDKDLYISILFFKLWLATENNYRRPLDQGSSTEMLDDLVKEFKPETKRQKILYLIAKHFDYFEDEFRLLKKALEIARSEPNLIRERSLALYFFILVSEDEFSLEIEKRMCISLLYDQSSWPYLYAEATLAISMIKGSDKEKGWAMFDKALKKMESLDSDLPLIAAAAIEEVVHLLDRDEREKWEDVRIGIAKGYGSPGNPLAEPLLYIPDRSTLPQRLRDAEKKGESAETILQLFRYNSVYENDEIIISSLDPVFTALDKIETDSSDYAYLMQRLENAFKNIKDKEGLKSYFLNKADGFDSRADEQRYRNFCTVVKSLDAENAIEVFKKMEDALSDDHRYKYILTAFEIPIYKVLNGGDIVVKLSKSLIKGYDELGLDKDVSYYKAYHDLAIDYLKHGNENRYIRYLKKAASGLEEILGLQGGLVIDWYLEALDYLDNKKDADSKEYALSVADKLIEYFDDEEEEFTEDLLYVLSLKAECLNSMGRDEEALEIQKTCYERALEMEGPNSDMTVHYYLEYTLHLTKNNELDKAIELLETLERSIPDGSDKKISVQYVLMMLYRRNKRDKDSYAIAQILRRLEKKLSDNQKIMTYYTLGLMYGEAEDYKNEEKMKQKCKRLMSKYNVDNGGEWDERIPHNLPIDFKF